MRIEDAVVKYRPSRIQDSIDQQIAHIPFYETDQIDCAIPYYILNGRKVKPNPSNNIVFKLNYLRMKQMSSIKMRNHRSGIFKITDLVAKDVIEPFILFIDRRIIPYGYISIIIDGDSYYILIECATLRFMKAMPRTYSSAQIISLPEDMFWEQNKIEISNPSNKIVFGFDSSGTYTYNRRDIVYAVMKKTIRNNGPITAEHSYMVFNNIRTAIDAFKLYNPKQFDVKVTEKNVFLFCNGLLYHSNTDIAIRRLKETTRIENGVEVSVLEEYKSPNTSNHIPYQVVGELLSVDSGNYNASRTYDILFFMNDQSTVDNLDNMMRVSANARSTAVKSANKGSPPTFFSKLNHAFDLSIDREKSFANNMSESKSEIMGYNPHLFNEFVKSKSQIDIQEFSGSDIIDAIRKANFNGKFVAPLRNNGEYEERVLLFINGILHVSSDIDNNTSFIPVGSTLKSTDVIEIMRFKNVNNMTTTITVGEDDGFVYHSDHIINSNMRLFCRTPSNGNTYPEDGDQIFDVAYTLEDDNNGNIKITLSDSFYYGKPLIVASKNRFIHHGFSTSKNDTYRFVMGRHFEYCTDLNRYMVFVNGRLLGREQYEITLPTDPDSTNYIYYIKLNTAIDRSDKLDIIYSSVDYRDIYTSEELDPSGDIKYDGDDLQYTFSKELYMVWLNGKKVPISHIMDVNSRTMRIIKDQASIYNLRVIKYIECADLATINHNGFAWDNAVFNSGMSDEEINTILGFGNADFTNSEPNIADNNAELQTSIVNNVIIITDTKSIATFAIANNAGVLNDESESLIARVNNNVLYIEYEGG